VTPTNKDVRELQEEILFDNKLAEKANVKDNQVARKRYEY